MMPMAFRYADLQTREIGLMCDYDGCVHEAMREFHDEGLTGQSFCTTHFKQLQRSRLRAAVLDEFRSEKQLRKLANWRCQTILQTYGR